ncbi:lytic transglycosylase domain-containing protein [Psychromonas sp. SP041]|uniref:lytic transglycosylase domain-containing protein n=1 Tax=Psychromonas sp. SP041 TaxID=1365007 RepID=UPI001485B589|nr:lytic transglycosylase domain-containing protein [Psychromonas sp. SP041]
MSDLPIHYNNEVTPTPAKVTECVNFASKYYNVNPSVIRAIIAVEGGKIGTMSRNSNGTYDMGIMQINTIHIKDLRKRFPTLNLTRKKISNGACVNIFLAVDILNRRIKENSNYWLGVGSYHSKTPKYRNRYLKKIYKAYKRIVSP